MPLLKRLKMFESTRSRQLCLKKDYPALSIGFKNLEILCLIGVLPHEKATPQKLRVSLSVTLQSVHSDHLAATIDYTTLAALCRRVCQERHRELIETLAIDLFKSALSLYPLSQIAITIEKPEAFTDADCAFVNLQHCFDEV
jgi:dihydroneopterin aldolase